MESIIKDNLVQYLEENNLITNSQHGFRQKRSCLTNLLEYVEKRSRMPLFANARTISNAIDTARMRHANRMFNSGDAILTKSDLVTIEVRDITESSLFTELGE